MRSLPDGGARRPIADTVQIILRIPGFTGGEQPNITVALSAGVSGNCINPEVQCFLGREFGPLFSRYSDFDPFVLSPSAYPLAGSLTTTDSINAAVGDAHLFFAVACCTAFGDDGAGLAQTKGRVDGFFPEREKDVGINPDACRVAGPCVQVRGEGGCVGWGNHFGLSFS